MGVIQRQSIKYSLVNIVGLAIGTLSTLFIYPRVLEANGTLRFLLDTGMVFLPLLALGANTLTNRFFPKFENRATQNHGFLPLILALTCTGLLFFGLLLLIFWGKIENFYFEKTPGLAPFLRFVPPIAAFYVLNQVLFNYSANFKRIVVPTLLIDFSQKLVLPALLFAVWQGWISLETACWSLVAHGAAVLAAMVFYLKKIGAWLWGNFREFITPDLRREMLQFTAFGVVNGLALLVAAKVDGLMVGTLLDREQLGIFSIALQIAAVIEVPIKGLYSASVSTLTRHLHDEDFVALEKLYKQVSIHLLLAGLLLFCSIWISLESLFRVLENSEKVVAGRWVFFFIGMARLIEMSTGLNNNIIYYSKHYRWTLLSLSATAVLTILLNVWLIPVLGIVGAAVATCCSVFFYNSFTVGLVWVKFRLQPFSSKTFLAIALAAGLFFIVQFLPSLGSDWLDIFLRSGLFAVAFCFLGFKFEVSAEANRLFLDFLKKAKI